MQEDYAPADLLKLNISISATPTFIFNTEVPLAEAASLTHTGFTILPELLINFQALSNTANQYFKNKKFTLLEGIFERSLFINNFLVYAENEKLVVQIQFSGSNSGTLYLSGTPVYNAATQNVVIEQVSYQLKTTDFLLKAAKWIFNNRIEKELQKFTTFPLAAYHQQAVAMVTALLHKTYKPGLRSTGALQHITVSSIAVLPQHLKITYNLAGAITVLVDDQKLFTSA